MFAQPKTHTRAYDEREKEAITFKLQPRVLTLLSITNHQLMCIHTYNQANSDDTEPISFSYLLNSVCLLHLSIINTNKIITNHRLSYALADHPSPKAQICIALTSSPPTAKLPLIRNSNNTP